MNLTDEQKQLIRESFKDNPSLIGLTRKVFDNDELDGRSKEGRAVKKYLSQLNLDYQTTAWDKQDDINLTEEQIDFIKAQAENGLSAFQISEILFPDINVKRLSKHHLCVLEFLREYSPHLFTKVKLGLIKNIYPKIISTTISKINEYCQEKKRRKTKQRRARMCRIFKEKTVIS